VKRETSQPQTRARRLAAAPVVAVLAVAGLWAGACASSTQSASQVDPATAGAVAAEYQAALQGSTRPPSPDPRIGLKAGLLDPGVAAWNLRLVANRISPEGFVGVTNSDLAFTGDYVIQGNYNGIQVWDVSNPSQPTIRKTYLCPASQSDVSVYGNLMFVSGEGQSGRLDCGTEGIPREDSVSHHRLRGIRIFDMSDVTDPKYIANVQTCRGSHTHTVVEDPNDRQNVYIYVSGSSSVRSPLELAGCSGLAPSEDPNSALFRIEVIRVPLAAPQQAAIVSSPRIFQDLVAPPRHAEPDRPAGGRGGRGGRGGGQEGGPRPGPNQCHDITVYPAVGLAGGACGGYGLLLDIRDVANPVRLDAAADSNFSYWHSATFSNDGSKVLFTDEWGGGSAPRCRATDKYEWGANAIFTIENRRLQFHKYYKMPAAQTELENCVAHNGSLVPIPGREVMVQGWYQGGISIFDWTDPNNPYEIAFFDRGPVDPERLRSGGSWSVYWYNGYMYSSEMARGLDVFELVPSGHLTQNEIDAAKTVVFDELNAQGQPQIVWPPSFPLARAYTDQLQRSNGLNATRLAAVRSALQSAEGMSGTQRRDALSQLATSLDADARGSSDAAKVRLLATAVRDLASAQ
jgi:LVIVD repeat